MSVDLKKLFCSKKNLTSLFDELWKYKSANSTDNTTKKDFLKIFNDELKLFVENNELNQFEEAIGSKTQTKDYVSLLQVINLEFVKECKKHINDTTFLPTEYHEQGIRAADLKPSDLDVWERKEVYVMNKNFRYNNKIPVWQHSMQKRHYDRDNEGIKGRSIEGMNRINWEHPRARGVFDFWKNKFWFG